MYKARKDQELGLKPGFSRSDETLVLVKYKVTELLCMYFLSVWNVCILVQLNKQCNTAVAASLWSLHLKSCWLLFYFTVAAHCVCSVAVAEMTTEVT